ncbi:hypothetical protein [Dactylosporangium darangshiense]|uniref:hypothetical protein n=1 Tax=Dactylosporangium darangshiense TaxID=579108 RepID=UPI0036420269
MDGTSSTAPPAAPADPGAGPVDAVAATGVDRAFGGVQALRDASFAARPGEIHALAGRTAPARAR